MSNKNTGLLHIKQIIPKGYCLSCDICCRFLDKLSVMRPYFLREDTAKLKKQAFQISQIRKGAFIKLIKHKDMYICPYFNFDKNKCSIYRIRPFDCRLYPFFLTQKDREVFLYADINCPFVKENMKSELFTHHIAYLKKVFSDKGMLQIIVSNKKFIGNFKAGVVFLGKLDELTEYLNAYRKKS